MNNIQKVFVLILVWVVVFGLVALIEEFSFEAMAIIALFASSAIGYFLFKDKKKS